MRQASKIAAKDSCNFALNRGNSNETNIKISPEIAELFGRVPNPGESFDVSFSIEKGDFLRSFCQIMGALPLYNNKGQLIHFSEQLFQKNYKAIFDFFGEDSKKEIGAKLARPEGHPICLNFGSNNFCIRDYLVESRSLLTFTESDGRVKLNIRYDENNDETTEKTIEERPDQCLQQIFYGAPGTGKSHEIKRLTKGKEVIRTTFHPDSDYSTFVGAYKPTSIEVPVRDVTGKIIIENGKQVTENRIVYEFVEQAFLQAYTKAWRAYANKADGEQAVEQFLVIEEINRGNCAQIFGDLFQLLDRNNYGFSEYPITADKDMQKQLAKAFKGLTIADAERINKIYEENVTDIVSKILNGEIILLPVNLYIWATMNTSDQSLFPIDSAFKRRWDWKYTKIAEGHVKDDNGDIVLENGKPKALGWKVRFGNCECDWWEFIIKINEEISSKTSSDDKKLGYFFCTPRSNNSFIDEETFVGKVLFYLWNDVFKDNDNSLFNLDESKDSPSYDVFYTEDNNGKTIPNSEFIKKFIVKLGVAVNPINDEDAEDSDSVLDKAEQGSKEFYYDREKTKLRRIVKNVVETFMERHPEFTTAIDIRDNFKQLTGYPYKIISTQSEYNNCNSKKCWLEVKMKDREVLYVFGEWRAGQQDDNFFKFYDYFKDNKQYGEITPID